MATTKGLSIAATSQFEEMSKMDQMAARWILKKELPSKPAKEQRTRTMTSRNGTTFEIPVDPYSYYATGKKETDLMIVTGFYEQQYSHKFTVGNMEAARIMMKSIWMPKIQRVRNPATKKELILGVCFRFLARIESGIDGRYDVAAAQWNQRSELPSPVVQEEQMQLELPSTAVQEDKEEVHEMQQEEIPEDIEYELPSPAVRALTEELPLPAVPLTPTAEDIEAEIKRLLPNLGSTTEKQETTEVEADTPTGYKFEEKIDAGVRVSDCTEDYRHYHQIKRSPLNQFRFKTSHARLQEHLKDLKIEEAPIPEMTPAERERLSPLITKRLTFPLQKTAAEHLQQTIYERAQPHLYAATTFIAMHYDEETWIRTVNAIFRYWRSAAYSKIILHLEKRTAQLYRISRREQYKLDEEKFQHNQELLRQERIKARQQDTPPRPRQLPQPPTWKPIWLKSPRHGTQGREPVFPHPREWPNHLAATPMPLNIYRIRKDRQEREKKNQEIRAWIDMVDLAKKRVPEMVHQSFQQRPQQRPRAHMDMEEKSEDKQQNITFMDNRETEVEDVAINTQIEHNAQSDSMQESVWTIKQMMEKPYPIFQRQWKTSDAPGDVIASFSLPHEIFKTRFHSQIIQRYTFFRGHPLIMVQLNGTKFHTGQIVVLWVPRYADFSAKVKTMNYQTAIAGPHFKLNASISNSGQLHIPFTHEQTYLTPNSTKDPVDIGQIMIYVLNRLTAVNGTSPELSFTVWGSFQNCELHQPAFYDTKFNQTYQRPEEEISPFYMKPKAQAGIEGFVKSAAPVAARAALTAAGGPAGAMAGMCLDKPSDPIDISRFVPNTMTALNYGDGIDRGTRLSLYPGSITATDPDLSGTQKTELDLNTLVRLPGIVGQVPWKSSDPPGARIFQLPVYPSQCSTNRTVGETRLFTPTSLAYFSRMFRYYRGPIKCTVQVVASAVHSGRLAITSNSTLFNTDFSSDIMTQAVILDLQENATVTFEAPFMSKYGWLRCDKFVAGKPDNYDAQEAAYAIINIYVLNSLVHPDTAAPEIDVNISYSAGDGFELAVPADLYCSDGVGEGDYQRPKAQGSTAEESIPSRQGETAIRISKGNTNLRSLSFPIMGENFMDLKTVLKRKTLCFKGSYYNGAQQYEDSFITIPNTPTASPVASVIIDSKGNWIAQTARTPLAHTAEAFTYWTGSLNYTLTWKIGDKTKAGIMQIAHIPDTYAPLTPIFRPFTDNNTTTSTQLAQAQSAFGAMVIDLSRQSSAEFSIPFYTKFNLLRTDPVQSHRCMTGHIKMTLNSEANFHFTYELYQGAGDEFDLKLMRFPPQIRMRWEEHRGVSGELQEYASNYCPTPKKITYTQVTHPDHPKGDPPQKPKENKNDIIKSIEKVREATEAMELLIKKQGDEFKLHQHLTPPYYTDKDFKNEVYAQPNLWTNTLTSRPAKQAAERPKAQHFMDWIPKIPSLPKIGFVERIETAVDKLTDPEHGPVAQVTTLINAFMEKAKTLPLALGGMTKNLTFDYSSWIFNLSTIVTAITTLSASPHPVSKVVALVSLVGALIGTAEGVIKNKLYHLCTEVMEWFSGHNDDQKEHDSKKPEELSGKPKAQSDTEPAAVMTCIAPFSAALAIAIAFFTFARVPNTPDVMMLCRTISEKLRLFNFTTLAVTNLNKVYALLTSVINWVVEWVISRTNPEMLAQLALTEGFADVETWVKQVDQFATEEFADRCLYDPEYKQRLWKTVDQGVYYRELLAKGEFGREASFIKEYAMRTLEMGRIAARAHYTYPVRPNPMCISLFGDSGIGKSGCVTMMAAYIMDILGYARFNRWCTVNQNEEFFTENYDFQSCVYIDDFGQMAGQKGETQYATLFTMKTNNTIPLNLAFDKGKPFKSDFIFMTTNVPYPKPNCVALQEALLGRRDALIETKFVNDETEKMNKAGFNVKKPDFSHMKFRFRDSVKPDGPRGTWMSFETMTVALAALSRLHLNSQYKKTQDELTAMGYAPEPAKPFEIDNEAIKTMIKNMTKLRLEVQEQRLRLNRLTESPADHLEQKTDVINAAMENLETIKNDMATMHDAILNTIVETRKAHADSDDEVYESDPEEEAAFRYLQALTRSPEGTFTPFIREEPQLIYSESVRKQRQEAGVQSCQPSDDYETPEEDVTKPEEKKKKASILRRAARTVWSWNEGKRIINENLIKAHRYAPTIHEDYYKNLKHNGKVFSLQIPTDATNEKREFLVKEEEALKDAIDIAEERVPLGFKNLMHELQPKEIQYQYFLWQISTLEKEKTTTTLKSRISTKFTDFKERISESVKKFFESHPTLAKIVTLCKWAIIIFIILVLLGIIYTKKLAHRCICAAVRYFTLRCGVCGKWPNLPKDPNSSMRKWILKEWEGLHGDVPYIDGYITTLEEERRIREMQNLPGPLVIDAGAKVAHSRYSSSEVRGGATRSRIANGLLETGDQGVHDLIERVKPALYRIRHVLEDGRAVSMNALAFHARRVLINSHFFDIFKDGDTFEIYYDGAWMPILNLPGRRHRIKDKDFTVFDMPVQFHQHRTLQHHFITEKDLAYCDLTPVSLLTRTKTLDTQVTFGAAKAENEVDYDHEYEGKSDTIIIQRAWKYTNIPVQPGYCGSVLISHQPRITGKILGLHVCGTSVAGWSALITREMISPYCTGTQLGTPQPKAHSVIGNLIPEGHFGLGGTVSPKEMVIQPAKSQIIPTAIHGMITAPTTFPSVLTAKDPRLIEHVSPLRKGIAKYGQVSPEMPEELVEAIMEDMREEVDRWPKPRPPQLLTIQQAVLGIPELKGFEKLPLDTSPGWPYTMTRPSGESGKAYLFNDDGTIKDNDLATRLEHRLRMARRGERVVSVWTDCLKDERRPLEKIQTGSTRLFTIPPVDYSLMVRIHTMDFLVAMRNARNQSFSQVGMDCQSPEWNQMYRRLAAKSPYVVAGDYTAFDGTQSPQQIRAFYQLIYYYYTGTTDPETNMDLWNTLMVIAEESTHTTHLAKDQIWISHKGNKSGDPVTVDKNCFVGSFNSRLAWLELSRDKPEYHNMAQYHKHVEEVNYGDDDIKAITLEALEWYNQETISPVLAKYNITYTNSQKTGLTKYLPLKEATFLKSGFKQHHKIKTLMVPTMSKNTIHELLNWTRISPNDDELLESNCSDALRFAYFYGREYFSELRGKICDALKERGKTFRVPTFMDYEFWFFAKCNLI